LESHALAAENWFVVKYDAFGTHRNAIAASTADRRRKETSSGSATVGNEEKKQHGWDWTRTIVMMLSHSKSDVLILPAKRLN